MIADKSLKTEKFGEMMIVLLALGITAFIFLLALSDSL